MPQGGDGIGDAGQPDGGDAAAPDNPPDPRQEAGLGAGAGAGGGVDGGREDDGAEASHEVEEPGGAGDSAGADDPPGGSDEDEFEHQGGGTAGAGGADAGAADGEDPGADGGGPVEGGDDAGQGEPPATVAQCFAEIGGDLGPEYDQFEPVVGSHCQGTNHQEIAGIERVVFLGDSVTVGTPPWLVTDYYWVRLYDALKRRFGEDLEVQNCAKWGARTDDLLEGKREIAECFPDGGDDRTTLVVMTIGGNDLANWASNRLGVDEALAAADEAAAYLDDALAWFREPERFPNGVHVIVGNPYEYTDATGDVSSCLAAGFAGLEGNWIEGAPAVIHLHERYMEMAVRHGTDIVFLLEAFCGHGYHRDDPESQCYHGPNAELWFDFTCIHPNPAGHAVIAQMFEAVVAE